MATAVRVMPSFTSFETLEAVMEADKNGFATARVSYYARSDAEVLRLLRSGRECPLVAMNMMKSARFLHGNATTDVAGTWKVTLSWKGAAARLRLLEAGEPKYTPIAMTQPIETHPLFDTFAGTPGEGKQLNGAIFDDHNNFSKFSNYMQDGQTVNPFAGIESYYMAVLKVGESRGVKHEDVARTAQWDKVGKICVPTVRVPVRIALSVPGMPDAVRDYLLVSVTIEDLGNGYAMVDREWDMSGPFGWDKDIYEYDE